MRSLAHLDIPAELVALRQCVLWRYETRDGKQAKVPITAMGYRAAVTNPEHWSSFDYLTELLRKHSGFANGVGFVFTADDPFCGLDLDNIWLSDAAETPRWAAGILKRFADTYCEESPSGRGVKIWCRAKLAHAGRWPIADHGAIEIYDRARYFAVTGRHAGVLAITDHQADVEALFRNLGDSARGASPPRIAGVIPHGTQHCTLVSIAGTLRRRGACVEAIEAALLEINRHQCEEPGSDANIRRIAQSAAKWSA